MRLSEYTFDLVDFQGKSQLFLYALFSIPLNLIFHLSITCLYGCPKISLCFFLLKPPSTSA